MLESEWGTRVASRLAHGVTSHATLTAFVRELLTAGQEVFGGAFNRHLHDNFLPELNQWAGAYRAVEGKDKDRPRGRSRRAATPDVYCSESHTRPSAPASSTPGIHRSESHTKASVPAPSPPRTAAPPGQSAPLINQSLEEQAPPPVVNAPSPPPTSRGSSVPRPESQVKMEHVDTPSRPLAERITHSSLTLPPQGPERDFSKVVFIGLRMTSNIRAQEDLLRAAFDDLLHTRNSIITATPKSGYWCASLQTSQLAQRAITIHRIRIGTRTVPIDKFRPPGSQRFRIFHTDIPTDLAPLLEREAVAAIASAFRGQGLQFSLQSQHDSFKRDKKWILCFSSPPLQIAFSGFDVDVLVQGRWRRTVFQPVKPKRGCPTCHAFDHEATACRCLYHVEPPVGTFPQYLMRVPEYVP
ncbi:hypothetical protein BDV97DRAFT_345628 [Delphinella strobiligena]|nr:hypothetical protein BDV97DRAFT_345628 [Delphinella strobiligena]